MKEKQSPFIQECMSNNSEYAGNPLEPTLPKCNNMLDWAISRDRPKGKPSTTPKERPERAVVESNPFKISGNRGYEVFDSDTMLITDDRVLIRCASKYYDTFKVPTMVMESSKLKRKYTSADKANLDKFCDNDNIGVIVNLSQELNTRLWNAVNSNGDWNEAMKAYYDNCLLSVLSGLAIDMAKREYPIDCMEELQIVRSRYDDKDEEGKPIRPYFFAHVAKKKGYYSKKKNYKKHLAPMDFVQEIIDMKKRNAPYNTKRNTGGICSIGEVLSEINTTQPPRFGYVDLVISMVRSMNDKTRALYQANKGAMSNEERHKLASAFFDRCVNSIKTMNLNSSTMQELLIAMERPENSDIKRKLWVILFGAFGKEFSTLLAESKNPIQIIEECASGEDGDTKVFWLNFRHVNVK